MQEAPIEIVKIAQWQGSIKITSDRDDDRRLITFVKILVRELAICRSGIEDGAEIPKASVAVQAEAALEIHLAIMGHPLRYGDIGT
jgi:hypothetical protein